MSNHHDAWLLARLPAYLHDLQRLAKEDVRSWRSIEAAAKRLGVRKTREEPPFLKRCPWCHGSGEIHQDNVHRLFPEQCPECQATGRVPDIDGHTRPGGCRVRWERVE